MNCCKTKPCEREGAKQHFVILQGSPEIRSARERATATAAAALRTAARQPWRISYCKLKSVCVCRNTCGSKAGTCKLVP